MTGASSGPASSYWSLTSPACANGTALLILLALALLLGVRDRLRDARRRARVLGAAHVVLVRHLVPRDVRRLPLGGEHREQPLRPLGAAARAGRRGRGRGRHELLELRVARRAAVLVDGHGGGV